MPVDPGFLAQAQAQFMRELTDRAQVYQATTTLTEGGETEVAWPISPSFEVPCLLTGSGASNQEKAVASKVQAIIIQSILVGVSPDVNNIAGKDRITIATANGVYGPYEVIAPPIPRSNAVGLRIILGMV